MRRRRLALVLGLRAALAGLMGAALSAASFLVFGSPAPASALGSGPVTPPGLAAGISPGSGILSLSQSALSETLQQMVAAGVTWVRIDVGWPSVEQSPGSFDWSGPDRVISQAVADGLNVDALLSYMPGWAATPGTGQPNTAAFATFAAAAASHYGPMGVNTFEIWNEPNLSSNWGAAVSPASYAALLVAGYEAIKAADPNSFVVSGGLSPAVDASDGSQMSPATFLSDMYQSGAGGHFDAVAIHPYSFPYDPNDPASWNTFYELPVYHQIMANNGDGGKQIWSTEFGVPTGSDSSDGAVSEQTQGQQLQDATSSLKQWSWAGPLFYYNWQDGTNAGSVWDNFGLVDSSFNPKPALSTFESFAQSVHTTAQSTQSPQSTAPASVPSAPPAPANLSARVSSTTVTLSWSYTGAVQGINVYRDGNKLASVGAVTSFTDNSASGLHSYYVTAVGSGGESQPSPRINTFAWPFSFGSNLFGTAGFGRIHAGALLLRRG